MKRKATFAAAFGVIAALSITPAYADDPAAGAADAADVAAQAKQLFREGLDAAKLKKWDKARTYFLSAWRAQRHWKIALNLGLVEHKLGKWRDAAEHLTYGLREAPAGKMEAADRKEAEGLLRDATRKVGSVWVDATPEGAEIRIDGIPFGQAPLRGPLFVEPGAHSIMVARDGHEPSEGSVTVGEGKEVRVQRRLTVKAITVPLSPNVITIAKPVHADKPASGDQVRTGLIAAGITSFIGAAGLGAGFGVASQLTSMKKEPTCCTDEYAERELKRIQYKHVMLWSFIAAGALGSATLIYGVASAPSQPRAIRASAFVAPEAGGVVVGGSF